MKKRTNFYIGIGIVFISLITASFSVVAWSNGEHTVGTYEDDPGWQVDPIVAYMKDYTMPIVPNAMRRYYGTHDWIAE